MHHIFSSIFLLPKLKIFTHDRRVTRYFLTRRFLKKDIIECWTSIEYPSINRVISTFCGTLLFSLMPRLGLYEKGFRRGGGGREVLSSFKIQYKLCTSQVAATVDLCRRI